MSVAGKPKQSSRSTPSMVLHWGGWSYWITLLSRMPSRKAPPYVHFIRSPDSDHVFRLEPVLHPDATAENFVELFTIAVARLAAVQAESWLHTEGRRSTDVATRLQVRAAVECALDDYAPESRKPPERPPVAPIVERSVKEHRFVSTLVRDRGVFLGTFSEEEYDRLTSLAETIVDKQIARVEALPNEPGI